MKVGAALRGDAAEASSRFAARGLLLPARMTKHTLLAIACAATALAGPVRRAHACGGFFCNQPTGPQLPVAQTAENVFFAMDRDAASGQFKLEAHVQIFYTGPADKFSWVVPVDSEPELDVGSDAIFTDLLGATEPRFAIDWRDEGVCKPDPVTNLPGNNGSGAGGASGSGTGGSSSAGGVSVSFRGDVGPFDAAVLRATSPNDPQVLLDWLRDNGYFVSPEGARLIGDYVREEKAFVAVKLLPGQGTTEIQPLVMRFLGPGPCVPLKLTAIAALADLGVNLWVLSENRVVPTNYFEIEINPAAINWFTGGANYRELVKQAANEAGGNAFTTDFVGPANVLGTFGFTDPSNYDVSEIRSATTPPDALDRIARRSFPRDGRLLAVLRRHIPLPAALRERGISETAFYNDLRRYYLENPAWFVGFDASKLADDLDSKFAAPLRRYRALIDRHTKLTRLATFISPEEMTLDPLFLENPALPDVPRTRSATAVRMCGNLEHARCAAPVRLELGDGQQIWFRARAGADECPTNYNDYERSTLDGLPALRYGWQRDTAGEGLRKFDRDADIKKGVEAHNRTVMRALARGDATAGPAGTGGAGATVSGPSGCGCDLGPGAAAPPLLLPLAFGLGWWIRTRRS